MKLPRLKFYKFTPLPTLSYQRGKTLGVSLLLGLVLLLASWGLFLHQGMFYGHDFLHGARIREMALGLSQGQFPVIWSGNFGFGYGMPLFEFYAPLPYFIGAIFYLLGINLAWCSKILFFIANIGTLLGVYFWAREFFSRRVAVFAAASATLASYRAVDIFARGALSEVWAIMALPWLFWGMTRIISGKRYGWRLSVVAGVGLALSHNLTAMMTAPVAAIYLLIYSGSWFYAHRSRKQLNLLARRLLLLASAAGACFALSAFYLLPALAEKHFTLIETYILGDYFNFRLHFLYLRQFFTDNFGYGGSGWGPHDGLSFFLGIAQLAGAVLTGGVLLWQVGCLWQKRPRQLLGAQIMMWGGMGSLLALILFFTTQKSLWFWEILSAWWAYIQFPWRFLGLGLIFLALFSAYGLSVLSGWWQKIIFWLLFVVLLLTSAYPGQLFSQGNYTQYGGLRWGNYFKPSHALSSSSPFYRADSQDIQATLSATLVDYLPADFANSWSPAPATVVGTANQPTVLVDKMHQRLYQFDLPAESWLEFTLAYYPGWRAQIDGEFSDIRVSETGNIKVWVPAGKHQVGLFLTATPVRFFANALSFVSLIIIIAEGMYLSWQRR